jgi:hypothetical protein
MEWCIPIQTFQVEHVQLGTLLRGSKPMLPLAYKDSDFQFPCLSILLPTLPVVSYDPTTGRLVLSLSEHTQTLSKLQTFQDMLLTAVVSQHGQWFPGSHKRPQEIRGGFQPMIQNGEIHLYYPMNEHGDATIPVFSGGAAGSWTTRKQRALKAGDRIRIAFRLYGVSFHIPPNSSAWSGKLRLQHKLVGVMGSF